MDFFSFSSLRINISLGQLSTNLNFLFKNQKPKHWGFRIHKKVLRRDIAIRNRIKATKNFKTVMPPFRILSAPTKSSKNLLFLKCLQKVHFLKLCTNPSDNHVNILELNNFDRLNLVTWLATSNHSALFQTSLSNYSIQKLCYEICTRRDIYCDLLKKTKVSNKLSFRCRR